MIEGDSYRFTVKVNTPPTSAKNGTKLSRGANFQCLLSGTPIEPKYIKAEGVGGRIGQRLMAIVAEGKRGRVYLSPIPEQEAATEQAEPTWRPDVTISGSTQYLGVKPYGFTRFDQLFTARQLSALTTFSDLVQEAISRVHEDALATGMLDDKLGLDQGGQGATAYAQAVGIYLAFAISKVSNIGSTVASWMNDRGAFRDLCTAGITHGLGFR